MSSSCYFNSQIGRDGEPIVDGGGGSELVRSLRDRNAHLSVNLIP